MKILIASVFVAIAPVPAVAQKSDLCAEMGHLADTVFGIRQKGAALSDVLKIVPENEGEALTKAVILIVYDAPLFDTPEYIEKSRREIRNDIEVDCYKGNLPN